MLPPDLLTLDTLLSSAIWGSAAAGLTLLAHGVRDRHYLIWRCKGWLGAAEESYPQTEGYVPDMITPEERAKLPGNVAYFSAAGGLFPVLISLDPFIVQFAIPLVLAAFGILVVLFSDDAEIVGAQAVARRSRWQRIRPHLLLLALLVPALFLAANPEVLAPIVAQAHVLPLILTGIFVLLMAGCLWRWRNILSGPPGPEMDIRNRGLAIGVFAFVCAIGIIALLAWVM